MMSFLDMLLKFSSLIIKICLVTIINLFQQVNSMTFDILPDEIVHRIVQFVSGEDLIELGVVNKRFHDISNFPALWVDILLDNKYAYNPICYGFEKETLVGMKVDQLKVLYSFAVTKWGWLIGFWKREIPAFGGLLFVKLESSPFRIVGYNIQYDTDVLRSRTCANPLFCIDIKTNKVTCMLFPVSSHSGKIVRENIEDTLPQRNKMNILCESRKRFSKDHTVSDMESYFSQLLGMNTEKIIKIIAKSYPSGGLSYSQISMPLKVTAPIIIQPGFFGGNYHAHGGEILSLSTTEDSIKLTKISGDRNVRSGEISIKIDLLYEIDYLAVLRLILIGPHYHSLNVQEILEQFRINHTREMPRNKDPIIIPKRLIDLLIQQDTERKCLFHSENDNFSYLGAFKGRITLGAMPEVENPEYYYNDILVVIRSSDDIIYFWNYNALLGEYDYDVAEICRLSFDDMFISH